MTRIIAVSNQKGGTGKSTTAVNLAAGLARGVANGKRVLLVDVDPQANATATFFGARYVAGPKPGLTVHDVLTGRAQAGQAVRQAQLATNTRHGIPAATLDVLPSHVTLAAAELELVSVFQRESRLHEALESIQDGYHYVVVDCPPSLGLLTVNALMAATEVLIPVDPGFYPLIGLNLLRKTISTVSRANAGLHIVGVLPTRIDRTGQAADTVEQLKRVFGDLVLPAIPQRVAISEAHAKGQDIFAYTGPASDGAAAYATLIREVMNRG